MTPPAQISVTPARDPKRPSGYIVPAEILSQWAAHFAQQGGMVMAGFEAGITKCAPVDFVPAPPAAVPDPEDPEEPGSDEPPGETG